MILETIKQFFANRLQKSNYGTNFDGYLGEQVEVNDLPTEVKQAYDFYKENVENADWGSVRVYQTSITVPVYTVYTSTDGDDGYLEIYSQPGGAIVSGKHDTETINWQDSASLRGDIA